MSLQMRSCSDFLGCDLGFNEAGEDIFVDLKVVSFKVRTVCTQRIDDSKKAVATDGFKVHEVKIDGVNTSSSNETASA